MMKARPLVIAALAKKAVDTTLRYSNAARSTYSALAVPPEALGRLAPSGLGKTNATLLEAATKSTETFAEIQQNDAGKLYQAAAGYQQTDHTAAGRIKKIIADYTPF